MRNERSIAEERLPEFVRWDDSIHKSIENIYESLDGYLDEKLDELFEYRLRHEICFGMRGVKVPEIYLGIGECGAEVSGEYDGISYRHAVDLNEFFLKFHSF